MAEEEHVEKRKMLFCVRGHDFIINPRNILKIIKGHHINENQNIVYTIVVYEPFGEQTIIEFLDEEVRDKEHQNLISKLDEFGVDVR